MNIFLSIQKMPVSVYKKLREEKPGFFSRSPVCGTGSVQWDFLRKSAHIPFKNRQLSVFLHILTTT